MELSCSPCSCKTITGFFSFKSRLVFEGIEEPLSSKRGIRHHSFLVSIILRIFCTKKIVDIKDIDGKVYHLNRGSLSNWLKKHHEGLFEATNKGMLNVPEYRVRRWLDEVLEKKSPAYIIDIAKLKYDLEKIEEQKKSSEIRGENLSIYERGLPAKIAQLRQELANAEAERAAANKL
ncbi:hypothetical protein PHSC3_000287 [Chlamydiales bacterium STE3]|nr:hypothetical protein PHSC3_000287 [Chlamydiales bacterium STE3]